MSEIKTQHSSDFFGKDGLKPFLGVIEDVNDPKGAARVKVRVVGIHPKDKEELSTEDLPWARVSAPTTHAQQARVGSKHGLMPDSWVWGFFLDGDDNQDLMVAGTFPFTARATEEDMRNHDEDDKVGTLNRDKKPFDKGHGKSRGPNVAAQTKDEQGTSKKHSAKIDPSGDLPALHDAKSLECGEARSASNEAKEAEFRSISNAHSQNRKFFLADGGCGNVPHLTLDTQKMIEEFLPSEFDRFKFGDAVWSKFTGSFMNINGILSQIGLDITGKARISINQAKAFQEDTINRTARTNGLMASIDRDGVATITIDEKLTVQQDVFHTTFSGLMDQLGSQVTGMMKEMDVQGIRDTGSIDIAQSIVGNIENIMNDGFDAAFTAAENLVNDLGMQEEKAEQRPQEEEEEVTEKMISAMTISDYAARVGQIRDVVQDELDKMDKEKEEKEKQNQGAQDMLSGLFGGALSQIGSVDNLMSFSMLDKYSLMGAKSHNRTGDETQDERTKKGSCRVEREYGTTMGAMASGKKSRGSSGDGSDDGDSKKNKTEVNKLTGIEFGGREKGEKPEYNNKLSDDAKTLKDGKKPEGNNAKAIVIGLPSSDKAKAKKYDVGAPNTVIVKNKGEKFFFENEKEPQKAFPSVYIKGYNGTPVPVVDKKSGEIVTIMTNLNSFNPELPSPSLTIIPDKSELGLTTDDPDYDFVLGGVFVANTGFGYSNPTISVIDKDTGKENGQVRLKLFQNRIVDVEIINNGTGFKRIPEIKLKDSLGYGAKLLPIINVIPKPSAKPLPAPVESIFCPAKGQLNNI